MVYVVEESVRPLRGLSERYLSVIPIYDIYR